MNATASSFLGWLLRSSWQAAVLTILVLLAQFCLRKRLDGRWRHLLWLLVLARLAMPFSPPSSASLFNYIRFEPAPTRPHTVPSMDFAALPAEPASQAQPDAASQPVHITAAPTVVNVSASVPAVPAKRLWTMPQWPVVLALVWGVGVVALAMRVVIQNILFRRHLRHGTVINDSGTSELFADCKAAMCVGTSVPLVETGLVDSPALYGLFRPRLLLPPRLAERFSRNELRHIFLHELAHVRRRDMAAQWLVMCFQIVHWFNPILWFGFRRMAADRELACDELALSVVGESEGPAYGQTIVKLLEACSEMPAFPGLVGILEDKSQIFQRVSMIAGFKKHPRWSLIGAVAAVALGVVTLTGAQSKHGLDTPEPNLTTIGKEATLNRHVNGRIVDKSGKGISNAVVNVRVVTHHGNIGFEGNDDIDQRALTGPDGRFVINGRSEFEGVSIDVQASGFAKGVFLRLSSGESVHELQLVAGATLKGRLLKDGSPLSGVRIDISGVDQNAESTAGSYSVVTDHDGQFCFSNITPSRDYYLFAPMRSLGANGVTETRRVRVEEDGSILDAGDLQVGKGFTLAGTVRLSNSKPVPPDTRVVLTRDGLLDAVECNVDPHGKFRFMSVPSDPIDITAIAGGYCPSGRNQSLDSMTLELTGFITNDKTDLVLELEPGERNKRESAKYDERREKPLTGAEGGYYGQKGTHVTGKVIDAKTGKRLNSFTVTEGRIDGALGIQWFPSLQVTVTNGELNQFLNMYLRANSMAVQAVGHLPQSSGLITAQETNITFALESGPGRTGTVLEAEGQPVPGAQVYLTNMRDGVQITDDVLDPRIDQFPGTQFARTDSRGRFQFPAWLNDYSVLIFAKAGFAEVTVGDLIEHPDIILSPWAKVDGTLLIGNRVGSNETVRLGNAFIPYASYPRAVPALGVFLEAMTDKDGRFSFDRVPPVDLKVYDSPRVRDEKWGTFSTSQSQVLLLKPGEDRTVTLGGRGRPVVGRFAVNGYDGVFNWRAEVWTLDSILPPTSEAPDLSELSRSRAAKFNATDNEDEKKRLARQMEASWQEAIAKHAAFGKSENGRKYFSQERCYALNFAPDGSFRIEDVPGGKYGLRIFSFANQRIVPFQKEILIPDSPGGRSDEPFDLGRIEIQATKDSGVGNSVPDSTAKRTARSDWSGKRLREPGLAGPSQRLTAAEVDALEAKLVEDPEDFSARRDLLVYYGFRDRGAKAKHVLWIIEHHPEFSGSGPEMSLDPIIEESSYRQGKALWLKNVKDNPTNTVILGNAAAYFTISDHATAEELLTKAQILEPQNPAWPERLGQLYKLEANGQTGTNLAAKALAEFEKAQSQTSPATGGNPRLVDLAQMAIEAGDLEKARTYATELLGPGLRWSGGGNSGRALFYGNLVLGRIALREGKLDEASQYLLKAGKTTGDPALDSFGPNMSLAKELLEKGKTNSVLEFFRECEGFWPQYGGENKMGQWTAEVKAGRTPNFGANLVY